MNPEPLFPLLGDGGAQWAMVALTLIGTLVSAVAVWFVWKSLKFNRDALNLALKANEATERGLLLAEEANQLARTEQRAWLAIQDVRLSEASIKELQRGSAFSAFAAHKIRNFGNSVATECFIDAEVMLCGSQKMPEIALKEFCAKWHTSRNASGKILFPGQDYDGLHHVAIFEKEIENNPHPLGLGWIDAWLFICVTYRIFGGSTQRQTGMACPLVHLANDGSIRVVDTRSPGWAEKVVLAEPIYTHIT